MLLKVFYLCKYNTFLSQIRTCVNGTGVEICTLEDIEQIISCKEAGTQLPECPKSLGEWKSEGTCEAKDFGRLCGEGMQKQSRTCLDGTGEEICTSKDTEQTISCKEAGSKLPDCPKIFGSWQNIGPCSAINSSLDCGAGLQEQNRTCTNGTGDELCSLEDVYQNVHCKEVGTELKDCKKEFGEWINVGLCIALGLNQVCGPGKQNQTRTCIDGTGEEICTDEDFNQIVTCTQAGTDLPDCPKVFGEWQNVEQCTATNPTENCGPGHQIQERTCQNGTGQEICSGNDMFQNISCKDAGSDLADCSKKFGKWENFGSCVPLDTNTDCGPGMQQQKRTCKNGTGLQMCTNDEMLQEISCKHANTDLPDCPKIYGQWTNQGSCTSLGPNPLCGPGQQQQRRDCTNGTGSEICSEDDIVRMLSCLEAESSLSDCPKTFTEWRNDGPCIPIIDFLGNSFPCGLGEQKQTRTCTDGTGLLICSTQERTEERIVSCIDAATALPDCPGTIQWLLFLYISYISR